jgi:hypothetical protein
VAYKLHTIHIKFTKMQPLLLQNKYVNIWKEKPSHMISAYSAKENSSPQNVFSRGMELWGHEETPELMD